MYMEEGKKENGCVISIDRKSWDREGRRKGWEGSLVIKILHLNGPMNTEGGENKLICTNLTSGLLQGVLGQAGEAGRRPQG